VDSGQWAVNHPGCFAATPLEKEGKELETEAVSSCS
jgi:hypothetical protein